MSSTTTSFIPDVQQSSTSSYSLSGTPSMLSSTKSSASYTGEATPSADSPGTSFLTNSVANSTGSQSTSPLIFPSSSITSSSESGSVSVTTTTTISRSAVPTNSGTSDPSSSSPMDTRASSSTKVGEIVGAAVGCFLLGILIASAVAFGLSRKQRRRTQTKSANWSSPQDDGRQRLGIEQKLPLVETIAHDISRRDNFDFLPDQVEDAAIVQKVLTLTDQIMLHVENYYQDSKVATISGLEGKLSRFGTPHLTLPLAACLDAGYKSTVLIKHCLAFAMFKMLFRFDNNQKAVLPSELEHMIAASNDKDANLSHEDLSMAVAEWKRLTAFFRPDLVSDTRPLSQSQSDSLTRFAESFETAFAPWASNPAAVSSQTKHLLRVLSGAVATASWLYLQPDEYRFDWDSKGHIRDKTSRNLVLVPAMYKLSHVGMRLTQPRKMMEATTQRM